MLADVGVVIVDLDNQVAVAVVWTAPTGRRICRCYPESSVEPQDRQQRRMTD